MEDSTSIVCKHCGDDRQVEIVKVIPEFVAGAKFKTQYHCDTCGKDFYIISNTNPYGKRN